MLFTIEASSPVPIYAQVVAQARAAIAAGELRAGDALPSVRQLAAELRVNPNTVAQAYRELEHEGLTYVQRGQGTFVAEVGPQRLAGERTRVARALVERMLHDAFRLGLTPAEVRGTLDACLAALPGAAARAAGVPG
jgi:GntR family transcriptional regulator